MNFSETVTDIETQNEVRVIAEANTVAKLTALPKA